MSGNCRDFDYQIASGGTDNGVETGNDEDFDGFDIGPDGDGQVFIMFKRNLRIVWKIYIRVFSFTRGGSEFEAYPLPSNRLGSSR